MIQYLRWYFDNQFIISEHTTLQKSDTLYLHKTKKLNDLALIYPFWMLVSFLKDVQT
jgi:hypothetical protein